MKNKNDNINIIGDNKSIPNIKGEIIEKTKNNIKLNLSIEGISILENSANFYQIIFDRVDNYYFNYENKELFFNLDLKYINTSSRKQLYNLIQNIIDYTDKSNENHKTTIKIHINEDNEEDLTDLFEDFFDEKTFNQKYIIAKGTKKEYEHINFNIEYDDSFSEISKKNNEILKKIGVNFY